MQASAANTIAITSAMRSSRGSRPKARRGDQRLGAFTREAYSRKTRAGGPFGGDLLRLALNAPGARAELSRRGKNARDQERGSGAGIRSGDQERGSGASDHAPG